MRFILIVLFIFNKLSINYNNMADLQLTQNKKLSFSFKIEVTNISKKYFI